MSWYYDVYTWLVANGLYRDVLATAIGLGAARIMAARPIRTVKASQARQEDLLSTDTPGGLAEVHAQLKKLNRLLGEDEPSQEPEDDTPDLDDGSEKPDEHKDPAWVKLYKKFRKGHGQKGPEPPPAERPHALDIFHGGHR